MLDKNGAASESRDELNLGMVKEVVIFASEPGVWLLLNLEDNVTRDNTGSLVAFATELDFGTAFDSTVNVNMKDLTVDDCLLAHAPLAAVLVLEKLTLTIAVWANSLESLDHGTHLAHHCLHAVAVAASASSDRALLAAATLAFGADNGPLKGELRDLSPVDVLERHIVSVEDRLCLLGTALMVHAAKHAAQATSEATATEELGKQVFCGHTAAATGTTL